MSLCFDCPRRCGVDRPRTLNGEGRFGVCAMPTEPIVARAALHFGEEPGISGERGSGTVFFSGCPLKCVFCQNEEISAKNFGQQITTDRLRRIFWELIEQGAHNINLVNPTHFVRAIEQALDCPLPVPVVYNCGGYETVEALKRLEGKIQIYLPDLKYADPELAKRCSAAGDYVQTAKAAICEMYRQTGPCVFDEAGILQKGVIIRHLILPGCIENSKAVIDWVADTFPSGEVLFSLMSQYVPCGKAADLPPFDRTLTREEYEEVEEHLFSRGIEEGYLQELDSADTAYIPAFDLTGVNEREDTPTGEAMLSLARQLGFSAAIIPTEDIIFDPSFRPYCAENLCGQYGANYSCPPDCGTPEQMERRVRQKKRALVLQTVWPIADCFDARAVKAAKKSHNDSSIVLLKALRDKGIDSFMAGASGCHLCEECAIRQNLPCRFPDLAFSCLSAYCIYVKKLAERCGMMYDCPAGEISFFGILFFD